MSRNNRKALPCKNNITVFSDEFVASLISNIRTSISSKCTVIEDKKNCDKCPNITDCDGLLRNYLYNETEHLERAITEAAKGKYHLDNNIPKFHTLAIQHLLQAKGRHYSVIQWIGSKPYSANYEETYDSMDYDFLRNLITEVLKCNNSNTFEGAYFKQETGENRFKIRWLLVGNPDCMKNNYDYIFYTIKQLESFYSEAYYDALRSFFYFYSIDENSYDLQMHQTTTTVTSQLISEMFELDPSTLRPSFGLFGSRFMFVDGTNPETHGTIYTQKYQEKSICPVDKACEIYEKILQRAMPIPFDTLKEQYEKILNEDPDWAVKLKETLEKKWR